jgi:predicted DNA-binding transcriptional regulator YafY
MSRARRLLDLVQELRSHRNPVTGAKLAEATGVSLRTLYRDIDALKAQGAPIEGEPGLGYVLMPGFMLPPLMFTEDEIEAIVLGSKWVATRADENLGTAARSALVKIASVLPADLKAQVEDSSLYVGGGVSVPEGVTRLSDIRDAIRRERKVEVSYEALAGAQTARTIWPFALTFFDKARLVIGWCELRQDFRSFRADRILSFTVSERRYPRRRQVLMKEWQARRQAEDAHAATGM